MSIYFYIIKKQKPMEAVLFYLTHLFTINKFKAFWTFVVYLLAAGVGGFDIVFVAALSLTVTDYVLWFLWGWKNNKLNKQKMKDGIWRFPLYYIAVFSGFKLDEMLPVAIQWIGPIHNVIIIYLGLIEFLSVAKWLIRFDVKLPAKLIQELENYRDEMDGHKRETDIVTEIIPIEPETK